MILMHLNRSPDCVLGNVYGVGQTHLHIYVCIQTMSWLNCVQAIFIRILPPNHLLTLAYHGFIRSETDPFSQFVGLGLDRQSAIGAANPENHHRRHYGNNCERDQYLDEGHPDTVPPGHGLAVRSRKIRIEPFTARLTILAKA